MFRFVRLLCGLSFEACMWGFTYRVIREEILVSDIVDRMHAGRETARLAVRYGLVNRPDFWLWNSTSLGEAVAEMQQIERQIEYDREEGVFA